jgi:hypothetical protein
MIDRTKLRKGIRLGAVFVAALLVAVVGIAILPSTARGTTAAPEPNLVVSATSAKPIGPSPLQAQINSATAGSTVRLPSGTFVGQLWVNKSVDLVGAGVGKTILQSPATMSADAIGTVFVVNVWHGASVQLSHVTVRVVEQCMQSNLIGVATGGGVGVGDNATLKVWDAKIVAYGPYPNLNQPCTTPQGLPGMYSFGRAVSIGLDENTGVGTAVQVEGHGTIENVLATGFDIFSLSVGGVRGPSGSTATIEDNTVRVGPGPYTAAWGIVVYGVSTVTGNLVTGTPGSDGGIAVVYTSATVTGNTIRNLTCLTAPFTISPACGIDPIYADQDIGIFIAGATAGTVIEHNLVDQVDAGILVEGPGVPAVISHNTIRDSTYYGLDVIDANQTFESDAVEGGMYVIAVAAVDFDTSALLLHDVMKGYSVGIGLLEADYPAVASLVVRH